jgi:hypothetical protein
VRSGEESWRSGGACRPGNHCATSPLVRSCKRLLRPS